MMPGRRPGTPESARGWPDSGKVRPFIEAQIAAITAVNDLGLVTRNLRDFAGFAGLKLESWFTA